MKTFDIGHGILFLCEIVESYIFLNHLATQSTDFNKTLNQAFIRMNLRVKYKLELMESSFLNLARYDDMLRRMCVLQLQAQIIYHHSETGQS